MKNALRALQRAPLLLGGVTGVLLCVLAFGLLRATSGSPPGPDATGRALCTQLQTQDYAALYAALSARLRAQGTSAQFIASQRELDILYGKVTACSSAVTGSGEQPALAVHVTRERVGMRTGAVTLINEASGWRIDFYDSAVV